MTLRNIFNIFVSVAIGTALLLSCGAGKKQMDGSEAETPSEAVSAPLLFSADSAFSYVARQVKFGPRVPGSQAHRLCGDWLAGRLRDFGATVYQQTADISTFDGNSIPMRNIFARFRPEADDRILLLAHWDSRPWGDHDPDPAMRDKPIPGANDGASGTGVLLEIARNAEKTLGNVGLDILLCDAEDWGTENDDDSWALGARHFIRNLPQQDYMPVAAILLDMVGAPDATFMREYFSQMANPALADEIWSTAASLGHAALFPNRMGSAVNDDHVELIKGGIPAIDIIDYREETGFFSGWHTSADNMDAISRQTLNAVGETLETFIRNN